MVVYTPVTARADWDSIIIIVIINTLMIHYESLISPNPEVQTYQADCYGKLFVSNQV